MSVFRPKNINRRLVGTATTLNDNPALNSGKGSPGNSGFIGPKKTPYLHGPFCLGQRCCGGSVSGVLKIMEVACGLKECCTCAVGDCKGFFVCCGPSTTKWFVAPSCTEVQRNFFDRTGAVTVADSCMGACGWFVPNKNQLTTPMFCCRNFWDCYSATRYWGNDFTVGYPAGHRRGAYTINMSNGDVASNYIGPNANCSCLGEIFCVRAFRCTP